MKILYFESCGEAPRGCLPVEWLEVLRERWSPLPSCKEPIDLLSEGDLWYPALWVDNTHIAFLGGEWRGGWEEFKTLFGGGIENEIPPQMDEIVERVEKGQLDPQEGLSLLRKLAEEVDDDIFREALQGASLDKLEDFKVPVVFSIDWNNGDLVLDSVGEEARELLEEVKSLASSLE